MSRSVGILASAGSLLLLATVVGRADEWTRTFQVTGKPDLRVTTGDGSVRISSWERNQIEAHVITSGWRIADNEVRVTPHQDGNRVELDVRLPRLHWNAGHRSVRIEISAPREMNPEVRTEDGNIEVEGVRGEAYLHSGDGHIEAHGLDGTLRAESGDGRIRIQGRFDDLRLHTGDGSIYAEVGAGSKIASSWNIHTGDGNVTLRLPDDFAADLDAHTGDGHISLDLPVTVLGSLSRSTVRGKMNGGGGELTIRTGDGSIHLEKI